jgi:hypothetical protein
METPSKNRIQRNSKTEKLEDENAQMIQTKTNNPAIQENSRNRRKFTKVPLKKDE